MKYWFENLYIRGVWSSSVFVEVDSEGRIISLVADLDPNGIENLKKIDGFTLSGIPNGHSHSFQYLMSGLTEYSSRGINDDFWSWRESMYFLAQKLNKDQLFAVTYMLYCRMLECGYTSVVEFHYLKHLSLNFYSKLQSREDFIDSSLESYEVICQAADKAQIDLLLCPVFYGQGGFGQPLSSQQEKFSDRDVDTYLETLKEFKKRNESRPLSYGIHSLRAASDKDIFQIVEAKPDSSPLHIHVAEQLKELEECKEQYGKRPVEWLLSEVAVDSKWSLVHATHISEIELKGIVDKNINVVLCPSTEANLGDGIFPFSDFSHQSGSWCIGSDSHIGMNSLEELRWLEYQQRLIHHQRNPLVSGDKEHSAHILFDSCIAGGFKALGRETNGLEQGEWLQVQVYDKDHELLEGVAEDKILSTLIFSGPQIRPKQVINKGKTVVEEYRHINLGEAKKIWREAKLDAFRKQNHS